MTTSVGENHVAKLQLAEHVAVLHDLARFLQRSQAAQLEVDETKRWALLEGTQFDVPAATVSCTLFALTAAALAASCAFSISADSFRFSANGFSHSVCLPA